MEKAAVASILPALFALRHGNPALRSGFTRVLSRLRLSFWIWLPSRTRLRIYSRSCNLSPAKTLKEQSGQSRAEAVLAFWASFPLRTYLEIVAIEHSLRI